MFKRILILILILAPTISLANGVTEQNGWSEEDITKYLKIIGFFVGLYVVPHLPFWILRAVARSNSNIVFSSTSELRAYQIALFLVVFAPAVYYFTQQYMPELYTKHVDLINTQLQVLPVVTAIMLVCLFGFQLRTTTSYLSVILLFPLKIMFVLLGTVIVLFSYIFTVVMAMVAYNKVKESNYGEAAMYAVGVAGSASAAKYTQSTFFGRDSVLINGQDFEDANEHFYHLGITGILISGLSHLLLLGGNYHNVSIQAE